MKLLVTLSRFPLPLDKGDKLRAYYQIKEIAEEHEVHLCCLNDGPKISKDQLDEMKKICASVEVFQLSKPVIYGNLLLNIFENKPFQVSYFHRRSVAKKIKKIVKELEPDHIYCQLIRTSEYVKEFYNIPKTIDFMDALSKGIERRIQTVPFWSKWLFNLEFKRLLSYENLMFEFFEHKTIISEQDRELIYHQERGKIKIVPNGINTNYFHSLGGKKEFDVVFVGNMSYAPNVDGAVYLVKTIMPLVWKKNPNAKVLLAGTSPHKRVQNLQSNLVHVSGWMDDIRTAYDSSKVFVAPLQIGTGLQNKLLEGMAMELPCITSSLVNNALGAEDQKEVLIGNTPKQYSDLIVQLLENKELRERIAVNGKEFVKRKFDWKATSAELLQIFKK